MTPITGPYSVFNYLRRGPTAYGAIPIRWCERRVWYKQTKPYSLPLNFEYYMKYVPFAREVSSHYGDLDIYYIDADSSMAPSLEAYPGLYNAVYAKFKEALGEHVESGVALAEGKQALDMIENRARQFFAFGNALRRGRFGEAANHLGFSLTKNQEKRMRRNPRTFRFTRNPLTGKRLPKRPKPVTFTDQDHVYANLYLEFHFGWSPLLSDIHDAAEVLSSPLASHVIKARQRKTYTSPTTVNTDNGVDKSSVSMNIIVDQTITLRARAVVVNPNLGALQQAGLANPLSVAWELVPFSFVADWFVNFGDFLGSLTDFAGFSLENPYRTIFSRYRETRVSVADYNYTNPTWSGPPNYYTFQRYTVTTSYVKEAVYVKRIVGPFPGPTLKIRDPWILSPRRALAGISLLIQQSSRFLSKR